jgi:TonB family protein
MRMRVSFVVMLSGILAVGSASAWAPGGSETSEKQTQEGTAIVAAVGSKDKPILVSSGVLAGLLQHKVDPVYPDDARKAKISGAVVMLVTVDDHGKIVDLSALAGPEMLRDAALNTVRQWTYKPYLLNGKPVFVKSQITINFSFTH